jgi:hypothetical protein
MFASLGILLQQRLEQAAKQESDVRSGKCLPSWILDGPFQRHRSD